MWQSIGKRALFDFQFFPNACDQLLVFQPPYNKNKWNFQCWKTRCRSTYVPNFVGFLYKTVVKRAIDLKQFLKIQNQIRHIFTCSVTYIYYIYFIYLYIYIIIMYTYIYVYVIPPLRGIYHIYTHRARGEYKCDI